MKKNVGALALGVLLLLAGIGFIGASVQSLIAGPNSEVKCHNEVMHPGERCVIRRHGARITKSYNQMLEEKNNNVAPIAGFIVGGVVLVAGGAFLWAAYRKRRE
jgi:hypothetical protein